MTILHRNCNQLFFQLQFFYEKLFDRKKMLCFATQNTHFTMDAYQNPKGKSPCFLANTTFFFDRCFFHEKIEVEKKVEYSFDAELSYFSIGDILKAIRAA